MPVLSGRIISKLDLLSGLLAQKYYAMPLGYYKELIYPLCHKLLDQLGDGTRVLDIGAGCGHFEVAFFAERPESKTEFVLVDSSRTLLEFADAQLRKQSRIITCHQRSYNVDGWDRDLGTFDAIVSHNSLFHLAPARVPLLYRSCYEMLRSSGILLNQQSFAPQFLKEHFKDFYSVLGPRCFMSEADAALVTKLEEEVSKLEKLHSEQFANEANILLQHGWIPESEKPFESLHLTVEDHLEYMSTAGFTAACVWKMMHFGLLAGTKGTPFEPSKTASHVPRST